MCMWKSAGTCLVKNTEVLSGPGSLARTVSTWGERRHGRLPALLAYAKKVCEYLY